MQYHQKMLATYGTKAAAARALGIAKTTFKDRLDAELQTTKMRLIASETHEMAVPEFPEERPSIDVILERITADYERKKSSTDAKEWFEIPVRDNLPFGLMFWGDPHVDNRGCDISLLRHHMRLAKHPAVFSVNIGDQMDGWVGRLAVLYADSQVTTHDARELSMWFLREVRWLLWLAGNHDMWEQNETVLRLMSQQASVKLLPWQAKFRFTFPNGNDLKVHAAHDFPGRSMHNIVHGNMRAARMTSPADLLVDGHLHDWGHSQFEMAGFNRVITSVRVAGYKRIDSYANVKGYQSARHGSSCLVIVDPNMEGPARMIPMFDIDQGMFVLDGLIARYRAGERGHAKATPALQKAARRPRKGAVKAPVRKQVKTGKRMAA